MKIAPIAAALALTLALPAMAQDKPVLTVYAYDSFVSDWGPGPAIETAYEAQCACDLVLIGAGDGAALLGRLKLEGALTTADIVIGLDTSLSANAATTGLFAPHGLDVTTDLPVDFADPIFLPFDWGWFAFVYDAGKLAKAPASFEELIASDLSIVIQDPRSSTPGLGLLMWVRDVYGDKAADAWTRLAPRIVTVTKGWSEAYGMFLEGEADMVLSYTTSPAYHLIAEGDASKKAAIFTEGHYMQIEVMAALASSDQPELARDFLGFMMSEGAQTILPTTNWMYPAKTPTAGLPAGFETLSIPAKSLLIPAEQADAVRRAALAEWLDALSK
ncbi:MAG: thiamine transport system substrate-binding protein [Paracoccaceae bacterium]|jgi:thiamine transport system substrate-binding protein